ncbi:D-tyrosyl-tRNA(Tyr) deacylase [Limnospira platensis NIES-39]|jgi:D-tyrosyl-tRNA(Tyr) deacylase|uniref:D-aminoacyl-tRNA deacylase n=2 Tax=Oscillatoriophycideae TaxID=1301283 RepID=A0A5M3TBT7_LIMPL|nr:D-tyrosyl-tRNA(Tyr) deacylase [Arthrospira platensis NIES-39]GCE96152.1 D-tyrosyl-tRNA(Tyr) deacylase [Arthrospira platensis NIES-46]
MVAHLPSHIKQSLTVQYPMRVVIQRVKSSQVTVNGQIVGKINQGLNLLVGISATDTEAEVDWMARKCLDLRLFPDPDNHSGRWDKSVQDIGGELLVVSQFTLYGDCRKGRRPSFDRSAPPEAAEKLYQLFIEKLRISGLKVATGEFGAMMNVSIENDGPVTLLLEREAEGH